MVHQRIRVRRARESDLSTIARFAQALAQLHVGFDARRFVMPPRGEADFADFFRAELARADTVLLVGELDSRSAGYAFVRMEPPSLEDLRGAVAWLHDIYVDPQSRSAGVGRQLIEAAKEAARALGSHSLMVGVSPHNAAAWHVFERSGMRPTMVEMRLELDA